MVINLATLQAGEFFQDSEILQLPVAAGDTFSKGDLVYMDPATDTWKRTPASAIQSTSFGVAAEDAVTAAATKKVRIITGGRATVIADGTILPTNPVMNATATAGQVIEYVAAGTVADINRVVGWYAGKATGSDRDGVTIANAANDDVIIITLKGRGGKY